MQSREAKIKEMQEQLRALLVDEFSETAADGRSLSCSVTKLDECTMWYARAKETQRKG